MPIPPAWMSSMMISCPQNVKWVAVSTTINPVTQTALVEVKRASTHDNGWFSASGSFKRQVPAAISSKKLDMNSWAGL